MPHVFYSAIRGVFDDDFTFDQVLYNRMNGQLKMLNDLIKFAEAGTNDDSGDCEARASLCTDANVDDFLIPTDKTSTLPADSCTLEPVR